MTLKQEAQPLLW